MCGFALRDSKVLQMHWKGRKHLQKRILILLKEMSFNCLACVICFSFKHVIVVKSKHMSFTDSNVKVSFHFFFVYCSFLRVEPNTPQHNALFLNE